MNYTKEKLIKANIRLRCEDSNHNDTCIELRDLLLKKYNQVLEAQLTKTVYGSPDFCVVATAMIHPSKKIQFEKSLKKLGKTNKTHSKVRDVRVHLVKIK